MLTLFTTPKPFRGHIGMIQRNAIQSWLRLGSDIEIFIFGNEEGAAEVAREFGVRHFPYVACNEYGTPLIHDYFQQAEAHAKHHLLCYVNADIVLFDDLLAAVRQVTFPRYLMGGQRSDFDIERAIDFRQGDWEKRLRSEVSRSGKLHGCNGNDYFVFTKGLFGEIPPFALGRFYWDDWLLYRARQQRAPLIDATKVVTIIHQNHDYRHIVDTTPESGRSLGEGIETFKNRALFKSIMMNLRDANWQLTPTGMHRKCDFSRWHLLNEIALQTELWSCPGFVKAFTTWLARQQWDRNRKRRYAEILREHPELSL